MASTPEPLLPPEVLMLVVQHLDPYRDQPTVSALYHTNRFLHSLTKPLRQIVVGDGMDESDLASNSAMHEVLQLRVQKVIRQPQFAWMVKGARLDKLRRLTRSNSTDLDSKQRNRKSKQQRIEASHVNKPAEHESFPLEKYHSLLEPAGLPEDLNHLLITQLTEDPYLVSDSIDAHLGFLLVACPYLELVCLPERTPIANSFLIGRLIMHGLTNAPSSSLNRDMFISGYIRELRIHSYSDVTSALSLLTLPSLRTLAYGSLSNESSFSDQLSPLPSSNSVYLNTNPLEIELDDCMLRPDGLDRLLSACAMVYSLAIRFGVETSYDALDWTHYGDRIRSNAPHLRHLLLDTSATWDPREFVPSWFGSFAQLTHLRSLSVETIAFCENPYLGYHDPSDVLPDKLETLWLLGVGWNLKEPFHYTWIKDYEERYKHEEVSDQEAGENETHNGKDAIVGDASGPTSRSNSAASGSSASGSLADDEIELLDLLHRAQEQMPCFKRVIKVPCTFPKAPGNGIYRLLDYDSVGGLPFRNAMQ